MINTQTDRVIAGGWTKAGLIARAKVLWGDDLTERQARHFAAALVLRFFAKDEANRESYRREAPTKSAWAMVQMCGLENLTANGRFN